MMKSPTFIKHLAAFAKKEQWKEQGDCNAPKFIKNLLNGEGNGPELENIFDQVFPPIICKICDRRMFDSEGLEIHMAWGH